MGYLNIKKYNFCRAGDKQNYVYMLQELLKLYLFILLQWTSLFAAVTTQSDVPAVVVWQIKGRVELRSAGRLNGNSSVM